LVDDLLKGISNLENNNIKSKVENQTSVKQKTEVDLVSEVLTNIKDKNKLNSNYLTAFINAGILQ
jgi:hypothetical protein